MTDSLPDELRRELLRIARVTLSDQLRTGRMPAGTPHNECLLQPAGAFVTLRRDGALRGCIGTVEPTQPLYLAVEQMAVAAATRDGRFARVTVDELPDINIEISVLSIPERIAGLSDVVIGRDGIIVEGRGARGLLLPQVAVEHNWDAEALLRNTCVKAQLPPDAWNDADVDCLRFSATVFAEPS